MSSSEPGLVNVIVFIRERFDSPFSAAEGIDMAKRASTASANFGGPHGGLGA